MTKLAICLFSICLLFSIASAGTVTLNGGCAPSNTLTNTTIFSISNSGNDTAMQMILTPVMQNAEPSNATYAISSLGPSSSATINVTAKDITAKGTSGAYFVAAYQQGGSVFTAVFPCVMSFGTMTKSQLILGINSSAALNGSAEVTVHAYNAGSSAVAANISLAAPPSFTYRSARYQQIFMRPAEMVNATFYLTIPNLVQSSYTVGAISNYIQDNLSYANFVVTVLGSTAPASKAGSLLFFGVAAAVVVVLALIGFSLFRSRGKKKRAQVQV
jgi:hypothetical protein